MSAASSAVASVLITTNRHTETRVWLGSTIRLMEGISPLPYMAVASTRQQLADVLMKQNYRQEAIGILLLVISFYRKVVYTRINNMKNSTAIHRSLDSTHSKLLWRDLNHYFALAEKIVSMHRRCNQIDQSLQHILSIISLADNVMGWDSFEFGMTVQPIFFLKFHLNILHVL